MAIESTEWAHQALRERHPVGFAVAVALAGAAIAGVLLVGLGLSLTEGLLSGPLGRWDEGVNDWFLSVRTPSMNAVSHVGSTIAMTLPIIGVAAVCVVVLGLLRRFRDAGFLLIALAVEASVFLMTTLIVARSRPTVPRLEPAPPTSSFPSGHTAAALTLYVGLALVIAPQVRRRWMRICLWIVAVAIPLFVSLSRIYAGMHHVTDVVGSVALAAGALATAAIAVGARREDTS